MNRRYSLLLLSLFIILSSCTTATISESPPRITYGGKYLEDRTSWKTRFPKQLGTDYYTSPGTPILATSNGKVVQIFNMDNVASDSCYDLFVTIAHGRHDNLPFLVDYGHLAKLYVADGDYVKREQVFGLTAKIPVRFGVPKYLEPHLHLGLYQPKPSALELSRQERLERILEANDSTVVKTVYNPDDYWLDSKPQCFDSNRDYSSYSNLQLTHPVACGAYGKTLL